MEAIYNKYILQHLFLTIFQIFIKKLLFFRQNFQEEDKMIDTYWLYMQYL